jgi:hypothetical protein
MNLATFEQRIIDDLLVDDGLCVVSAGLATTRILTSLAVRLGGGDRRLCFILNLGERDEMRCA